MYNNQFDDARIELNNALNLCHSGYLKNKQRILRYLIPVEMTKGNYPTESLLEEYELKNEYSDIVKAVINGDLGALEAAINKNQDSYV
jgi:hypothetical protein